AVLMACQSYPASRGNPAPPSGPAATSGTASASTAPILQSVTLRTNVPNGFGGFFSVVPDFHFIAPAGNAVYLRRELVSTDGNFAGANIRGADIHIAPEVQRRGATLSGGWRCGVARYYLTIRAYVIDADGNRSNAIEYTIHCNGG
ncbi:MAG TPA: hypothetical protein VMD56_12835, partial [Steroidobacteraceae bacterium]|nr:hypothetical protein [Steroidobacteraceae bacterium]